MACVLCSDLEGLVPPSPRFPVRLTLTAEASPPSERSLLPSATRIAEIEEGDSRETIEEGCIPIVQSTFNLHNLEKVFLSIDKPQNRR